MDEYMSEALITILSIMAIITLMLFVYVISIPFWSDTKRVCDLWEEQNGKIVCVKEVTAFCLERECSNE